MDQWLVDLLVGLGATFAGVLAGIPAAFWVERQIGARRRREEGKSLLDLVRKNLAHNLELMEQIKSDVSSRLVPTYPFDMLVWQAYSVRLDSIANIRLVQEILKTYYELEHLNRKLNLYLDTCLGVARVITTHDQLRGMLADAILKHIASLVPLCEKTLGLINDELTNRESDNRIGDIRERPAG